MFGRSESTAAACRCEASIEHSRLLIDATDCPEHGDIAGSEACRRTAIGAIGSSSIDRIRVETAGVDRLFGATVASRFSAAARFAQRVQPRDERLASLARRDPLAAAAEAAGRAGLVGEAAADTGLAAMETIESYSAWLTPNRVPSVAASHVDLTPPADGALRGARVLDSGATVRVYDRPEGPLYLLEPLEYTLDDAALGTLADAHALLLGSEAEPTPREAVTEVAGPDCPTDTLARALRKHTSGYGVFEDLFSDDRLSEVFVNAPASSNPLFVRAGGEEFETNVTLTDRGTKRLAAGLRAESGRAFSRATPTIDASLSGVGGAESIRVAGVREPVSVGHAFALREEGTDRWRLGDLVANGTITAEAAGLLSVAMERGGAILVAGPRGAGKTTMASALLWELSSETRLLAIEDTPELPVRALQAAGRDVQRLEAASDPDATVDPATALRTALRFGSGALAVGEVRGEEATVLYEAMRVGAASDTVIGTIHGDGYDGVRERVVADLGVPASSFVATDLLVTLHPAADGKRVSAIEEVTDSGGAALYELDGTALQERPRLSRGNSRLLGALARPDETYAEIRSVIESRADALSRSSLGGAADRAVEGQDG